MGTIFFLILFPLVVAFVLLVVKADAARGVIVKLAALVIAAASIYLAVQYFQGGDRYFDFSNENVNYVLMVIEVCLAVYIVITGIKHKKYLASVFAIIQTPVMVWFELTEGHHIEVAHNLYYDRLSVIMVLIIGIIGSLITVYALGYMKDFQHHHAGEKDRRPWFFFVMFLFLGAMFGLVMSNNLTWVYFFWEITSLCSFFLIGYTKTGEATNNAFRALIMNLLGGMGFATAILILGFVYQTLELSTMITYGMMYSGIMAIPAAFLAFAGITKAAQMPFNSWLLGAMVAPTPTSALLHSSTMVKAGVFLIIKLAPCLGMGNFAGLMTMTVGGVTFLMASFAAISQSNAKKVLAYSTIANLGLIVTCGGIGTAGAVWAGIMLIIFHAITKSLLFLCVGTAEHNIGSRNIEDMDGLFGRMPRLAAFMMIGIAGMFLAPFGMLISKWASMTAFVDSGNLILVGIICFGSAATAFYWTKWLGKLSAIVAGTENIQQNVHKEEWFVHATLVVLTIVACLAFPLISSTTLVPYLEGVFGGLSSMALSADNMIIMVVMVAVVLLLVAFFFGKTKKKIVPIYMSGVNEGDNLQFHGSMDKPVSASLRNWHMEKYFGEIKMNVIGCVITSAVIIIGLGLMIGSLVAIMTGGAA
ncbi:NADH-quinone oxidoreductase subunit L [Anaerovorax odorimutans]|uniref:NADH-quinone oxidoreductase subunit L n=1 Tax=Anaerovorax odorimutans TaxID=109327 RepID=A0ABT1RJX9_9FIRM|nr:proton-conducting transporter membrane subunit [Anaerovorax odorimutans]MCQ4635485.1 NADH-quinone oxidoreductase subunit L [Anaerovorax odorimutans]